MSKNIYQLIGFLNNPFANGIIGFVKPLLRMKNLFYIQDISKDNIIKNFILIDKPEDDDLISMEEKNVYLKKNDAALYAFAFTTSDILWGQFEDVKSKLSRRLNELSPCPFIKAEAAQFLGKTKDYLEAMDAGEKKLGRFDKEIAEKWRYGEYERVAAEYERVHADIFVGRLSEISDFEKSLKNPGPHSIVNIHTNGDGGIGKTKLLQQFQKICLKYAPEQIKCNKEIIDFYHTESRTQIDIMRLIAKELGTNFFPRFNQKLMDYNEASKSEKGKTETNNNPETLIPQIRSAFDSDYQKLSGTKVVLFFDTYETIQGGDLSKWLKNKFYPDLVKLNPDTHVIIAGRNPLRRTECVSIELKPFDLEETVSFLKECFYISSDEELEKIIGGKEAIRKIHKYAKGRPILLALFADWYKYPHNRLSPEDVINEIEKKVKDQEEAEEKKHELFTKILIDRVLFLKEPGAKAVLYMAFAYRRMTPDMFSYLTGISIKESVYTLLGRLKPLSFVKYKTEQQIVLLHDEMRDLITTHYWKIQDPHGIERKEIARKLVEYYDQYLLAQKNLSPMKKAVLYAEKLHYQLYADIQHGFKVLRNQFDEYLGDYQIYFSDLIGNEILKKEFYGALSLEQRLQIIIRRIRWRNEQNRWKEALLFFEDIGDLDIDEKDIEYVEEDRETIIKFLNKEKRDLSGKELEAYLKHERGIAYLWIGRLKDAVSNFQAAEKIFRHGKHLFRVAWEQSLLGYALYRKGDYLNAELSFNKAIDELIIYIKQCIRKSLALPNRKDLLLYRASNIYSNYNALFRSMGRFYEAVLCGEIAIAIYNDERMNARFSNALGETCKNLNRISEARKYYKDAANSLLTAPDQLLEARITIGKALVSYRHPDYIYLLEFYRKGSRERAIERFKRIYPEAVNPPVSYEDEQESRETNETMHLLADAQKILTDEIANKTNELADLYFYLGEALTIEDKWMEAIEFFRKSEGVAERVNYEYRKIDAVVGQIICYYFMSSEEKRYETEIEGCLKKVQGAEHYYANLVGKMEIMLANLAYEKYLSTYDDSDLYEFVKKYIIAGNHMYAFSRISRSRFYSVFQVLAKRMADIPKDSIPCVESLENLKDIWIYDLENQASCREYRKQLDEIIEFSAMRADIIKGGVHREDAAIFYRDKINSGIDQGGENLRFTPMYALMNLQLYRDFWGQNHLKTAEAYMELAQTQALNDNMFEARQNNEIALELIDAGGDDLLKARIYIRLGTISYRRGEYGRLILKSRKNNVRENINAYYEQNEKDLKQSLEYFQSAEDILQRLSMSQPDNKPVDIKLAHLFFRKAECLFIMGERSLEIEKLFKASRSKALSGDYKWREMAAIEGLITFYYLSGQWEEKNEEIARLLEAFHDLNHIRYAPVLMGRLRTTEGDVIYDELFSFPEDRFRIEKAFTHYIIASRVMADYSDKHFYEAVSMILKRIETLPKPSVKILYNEIYPKIQQKRPKREIAENAYKLVENSLFIHSEVINSEDVD